MKIPRRRAGRASGPADVGEYSSRVMAAGSLSGIVKCDILSGAMSHLSRVPLILFLLVASLAAVPALAQTTPSPAPSGASVAVAVGAGWISSLDLVTAAEPTAVFRDLQQKGLAVRSDGRNRVQGLLGGLELGYDRPVGRWAWGLGLALMNARLSSNVIDDVSCPNENICAIDDRFVSRVDSLGVLSARVGRSASRHFVFGRSGLAVARQALSISDDNVNAFGRLSSGLNTGSVSARRWTPGVTVGVGDQIRLHSRWSALIEYSLVRLQSARLNATGSGTCAPGTTSDLCYQNGDHLTGTLRRDDVPANYPLESRSPLLHAIRVGLSYRF